MGDLESLERLWIYDNELTGIAASFGNAADTLTHLYLSGNSFAEGTCLPSAAWHDVANNDFAAAGLAACPVDGQSKHRPRRPHQTRPPRTGSPPLPRRERIEVRVIPNRT